MTREEWAADNKTKISRPFPFALTVLFDTEADREAFASAICDGGCDQHMYAWDDAPEISFHDAEGVYLGDNTIRVMREESEG